MYLLSNSRNPSPAFNERNALGLHTASKMHRNSITFGRRRDEPAFLVHGVENYIFFFCFQVCSVLDSLEREYKREDDMLQKHLSSGADVDKVTLITQLISKHQEQKEAFLKACTLARRTAETFLKYSNRSLQFFTQPTSPQSTFKGPEAKVKG